MVAPEEAVPEEHPVTRDAQEKDPGRFMAGLPGKGRAEGVDSPGEDRMPGCVQAGPMMHPGDVEQELLDPHVLPFLLMKAILHLDAPLPHRIVQPIGRERENLEEKNGCAPPP